MSPAPEWAAWPSDEAHSQHPAFAEIPLAGEEGHGNRQRPEDQDDKAEALAKLPKVRAFSAQAALVVEWSRVRSERSASLGFGAQTLNLEFARSRREAQTGNAPGSWKRRYAWDEKVVVQLSPQELLSFTAVVLGWQESMSVRFHGAQNNRGFEMKRNSDGGLYLALKSQDPLLPMPVARAERSAIALLCVKVLAANHPEMDASLLLEVLRSTWTA